MSVDEIIDLTDPHAIPSDVKFNAELDFVNLLGDVTYVQFILESGYLKQEAFIRFLKYLEYWERPQYARFLRSRQSLFFIRRLQDPEFIQQLDAKVQLGEWANSCSITYLDYLNQTAFYAQQNQKYIEGQERAIERGRY